MSSDELPKVHYRRLGKSGLRVSVPILGVMGFGSEKWSPWVVGEDKVREYPMLRCSSAHRL
jgi:aryl-alcohol dehydrogenase-like predicted oxidoreductase